MANTARSLDDEPRIRNNQHAYFLDQYSIKPTEYNFGKLGKDKVREERSDSAVR